MIARIIAVLTAALVSFALPAHAHDEPIGKGAETLPIFDAHIHYKEPAWKPFPVGTVIKLMDKAGVAMALVSSTPDEGTIKLYEYASRRIVPELRPYHGQYGSSNWTKAPDMAAYLAGRMAKYPHRGIGEFHIHNIDPKDRPLLEQVAALALKHKAIIHVHSGAAPVKLLFEIEPKLTILWAHAGMSEPPAVILPLLDKHAKLFADTSYRENDILRGSTLDPAWQAVIHKHPDRFLVGTDTWVNSQWEQYGALIALNRRWLALLPRRMAELIAYKNAEKLFGRKVTRDLIGKR